MFENSNLYMDLEEGTCPGLLLGDSGYACLPFLMPPISKPVTAEQKRFKKFDVKTYVITAFEKLFNISDIIKHK